MINVLFFASLRETLGCAQVTVNTPQPATIAALLDALLQQHPHWQAALSSNNLLISRNHTLAKASTVITTGDEIAFFPPVSGG